MSVQRAKHRQFEHEFVVKSSPTKPPLAASLDKFSSLPTARRRTLLLSATGIIISIFSLSWSLQNQKDILPVQFLTEEDNGQLQTGCQNFPISLDQEIDSQCDKLRTMNEAYIIQDFLFGKGVQSRVQIVDEIGSGDEYVAMFVKNRTTTLPHILKTSHAVCGQQNVAQLADLVCYNDTVVPVFKKCGGSNIIDAYVPGNSLDKNNCSRFSPDNIRRAIKGMFVGINQLIDVGICHQDFSITNSMFDEETGQLCVIDLGLAKQTTKYGQCIGLPDLDILPLLDTAFDEETRQKIEQASWKASILSQVNSSHLINFRSDDTLSVIGVMGALLSLPVPYVYQGKPGRAGHHLTDDIPRLLGKKKVLEHVQKYNLVVPEMLQQQLESVDEKPVDWRKLRNKCNKKVLNDDAVSFLEGFITLSYVDRLKFLRKEAIKHPFLMNI